MKYECWSALQFSSEYDISNPAVPTQLDYSAVCMSAHAVDHTMRGVYTWPPAGQNGEESMRAPMSFFNKR